jgi:hypothetical protein
MSDIKKINEFFSKNYEFDKRAKEVFQKLIKSIDSLDVIKYGDHKREVSVNGSNPKSKSDPTPKPNPDPEPNPLPVSPKPLPPGPVTPKPLPPGPVPPKPLPPGPVPPKPLPPGPVPPKPLPPGPVPPKPSPFEEIKNFNRNGQIAYVLSKFGDDWDITKYTKKKIPPRGKFSDNYIKKIISDKETSKDLRDLLKIILYFRKSDSKQDRFLRFIESQFEGIEFGKRVKAISTRPAVDTAAPIGDSFKYNEYELLNENNKETFNKFLENHPISEKILNKNKILILGLISSMYRSKKNPNYSIEIKGLDKESLDKVERFAFSDLSRKNYIFLDESKVFKFSQFNEKIDSKFRDRVGTKKTKIVNTTKKVIDSTIKDNETQVVVHKNKGGGRDWRLFNGSSDNYVLVINGEHMIDGEGNPKVNPKITKVFWEFLDSLKDIQYSYKKKNLSDKEYKDKLNQLKTSFQNKI